jgi:hypothetical protein
VRVVIGALIEPGGRDWEAAVKLRDAARAEILSRCGEPDAGGEPHPLDKTQMER